ncbi:MAG: fused MFS/spermidine synthase [Planctomycetes bacterium]|nr:fused MFS/spermidine synthase [Planctomycetota bacterium]
MEQEVEGLAATSGTERAVLIIFALSGFSALVYQVAWQRCLFRLYGINVEAVTVVVTAFMLGLGLGSLLGGRLSVDRRRDRLRLFALVETGIGVFGLLSLPLFARVGAATLAAPPLVTALITFALLLLPTLLMGSTLPLLTAYLVDRSGNVGRSVGSLYFVNTIGSAAASVLVVVALLPLLGLQGAVIAAALGNFAVASIALRLRRGSARR